MEVALLDAAGVIVEVNEAWKRFSTGKGDDPPRAGVGASYLEVCDALGADPASRDVGAAVRAAIGGDLPSPMTIRILCDAPDEPRFFDVRVSSRVVTSGECLGATVSVSPVSPVTSGEPGLELSFPDAPRLHLEQLLEDLTEQAQSVLSTQGRLRALLRANAAVASDLSLPVVLRHIVEAARELVDARYAALGLVGADGMLSEFVHSGMDAGTVEQIGALPRGEGPLGLLISNPSALRLKDLGEHPGRAGYPANHPPDGSFLRVPVRVRDVVFGNLYLTESSRGEFTAEDEQLVTALAVSAAVAIENARLFAQAEHQRQWLEASTEMTQRFFAGGSEDPLDLVLRYATRGAAADFGRVVVPVDAEHGRVQAQVGSLDHRQTGELLALENTLCGTILRTAKPVLVPDYDIALDETTRGDDVPAGTGAVAGVPLLSGDGSVLGALLVVRRPGASPFVEHDLSLLVGFADHAGIAIALDRARGDREALLMLADHDRIAADLHDHVIQELFATGMGLHGMVHLQSEPEHRARLLSYVESLDETIRRIRTTIFQVQRPPPGAPSLRTRLLAVLADERPALGFGPHLEFSGSLDRGVPDDLGDDVVAVLREALSNVARHAHAASAQVRIALAGRVVEVEVSDDGDGIGDPSRSSGLGNLQRRAEAHGGTFSVSSPAAGGTQLRWTALVSPPAG